MASLTETLYYNLENRISSTAAGTRLPSVRQLMREHKVSQITVVNALTMLKERGYVESRIGDGTYTTGLRKDRINDKLLRIGIATHDFPSSIHYELIRNISSYCKEQGHQVLLHHFHWDAIDPFPNHTWRVDAVMMLSCQGMLKAETLIHMSRIKVPLVLLDRASNELEFDTVGLDNDTGGALAARQLIQNGHRKLAILCGQPTNPLIDTRIEGFQRFAMLSGIEDIQILDCNAQPGDNSCALSNHRISQEIKKGLNFTGLFCVTDYNALGAISALKSAGIRVPEDISVIGYDNVSESQFFIPPLTTIDQNRHEWGKVALQLIEKRCNENREKFEPQRILVSPSLVERASTARTTDAAPAYAGN